MTFPVDDVIRRLRRAGVELERGLSDREFDAVQGHHGFAFGSDHRDLLGAALPSGALWVDWRSADQDDLRSRLARPVTGVIFDVHENAFWPASWGDRPADPRAAEAVAREHLARVPTLVPLYGHRYLPAAPAAAGSPVLSVYQTDVIVYGDNLLDYVAHEFGVGPRNPTPRTERPRIPFWSALAEGADL